MQHLWQKYWFIMLIPVMVIFVLWQSHAGSYDDAFITYRYSANVLNGNGLVYNNGEWVLGTTAPGYAILLALLSAPFGSSAIPDMALIVNGSAFIVTLVFIMLMVFQVTANRFIAILAMLICMTSTQGIDIIASGMETSIFVLLITAGYFALLKDRTFLGAFIVGLLPLIRPEGAFIVAVYGITMMIQVWSTGEKNPVRWFVHMIPFGVVLLLPGVLYIALTWITYGTPLPHSMVAKSSGIYALSTFDSLYGMLYLIGNLSTGYFGKIGIDLAPRIHLLSALITITLAFFGSYRLIKQDWRLWGIPTIVLLHVLLYAFSATNVFSWYLANFGLFYLLLVWAGFYYATLMLIERLEKRESLKKIVWAVGSLIVVLSIATQIPEMMKPKLRYFPLHQYYQPLAQQIGEQLPAQTSVALPEIGILGYYMPHVYVLDAAGLVSPQTLDYYPVPDEERAGPGMGVVPVSLIRNEQPDMLIAFEIFGRYGIFADEWFKEHYTRVMTIPVDGNIAWQSEGLLVYSRNDFEAGLALAN